MIDIPMSVYERLLDDSVNLQKYMVKNEKLIDLLHQKTEEIKKLRLQKINVKKRSSSTEVREAIIIIFDKKYIDLFEVFQSFRRSRLLYLQLSSFIILEISKKY